ncbi:hypothetical protein [Pontiella sulfatireligans]|uniref:hypothetical protein n=1 Tax=Pontiella sulfatireligans TaxID=2750658 RepID=UPI00109C64B8|nr:hypothetical protein [Pontiella sulfatireligans]
MRLIPLCIAFLCVASFGGSLSASAPKFQTLHVEDGVLLFEDGAEVNLLGVNFQPALSWEYNRMKHHGVHSPMDLDAYKAMIDEAYDELQLMGCNLIRIHLSPGDICDDEGNLVENQWLDLTDYVLAKAEEYGMYTYIAFLNTLGAARGKETFVSTRDETKPIWMVDPEFMAKADGYIHQLLNRKNRYRGGVKIKNSPALALVEPINEPGYFKRDEIDAYPQCFAIYQGWLDAGGKTDSAESYTAWRTANTKQYINRMVKFFKDEEVAAVMSWSLEWPRMMEWTGEDVFEAAAESDAEIVSICLYPGQSESRNKSPKEVGDINYLQMLQKVVDTPTYHGWLLEDRFKGKARIVYEFETYWNSSSYLYPAMAKQLRALGIQAAAMWTYILPGQAEYVAVAHNLNLKTTPNKAAAFMAASEVMRSEPRFQKYTTSSKTEDYFKNTALSYEEGCSAFSDGKTLIYSESMPKDFVAHLPALADDFDCIVGHGNSPYAKYGGTGLYFIDSQNGRGVTVSIMPDVDVLLPYGQRNEKGEKAVALTVDNTHPFELNLPGYGRVSKVYRKADRKWTPVKTSPGRVRFDAKPGEEYAVKK